MDYKSTLNLPKTTFPMKANLPEREPQLIARWQQENLYGQIRKAGADKPRFILHDGPPYANGDIHIGHALNKILKDIIVRYKTMRGFDAPYVPGWDCHGMPIEHQLFKELNLTKHQIDQISFRQQARAYAQRFVDIQREQFQRLGVSGDWAHPYLTMEAGYELTILRTFRELVQAAYIYRGKKPVYWCATCETALAEAEVEYEDRQDISIYVKFKVTDEQVGSVLSGAKPARAGPIYLVIWTTTPWTLPANVAVAIHPHSTYRLVELEKGELWILGDGLADTLLSKHISGTPTRTLWVKPGAHLNEVRYERPFPHQAARAVEPKLVSELEGRVVIDEGVSITEGTGIVHIAPGHGHEDYLIGQRYRLDILSPVDHQGKFTAEVAEFAGQSVFDANPQIVADLKQRGLLLAEAPITHSYPHCWRCKQPVIFRATPQWFLKVDPTLRQRLLDAAKAVHWVPPAGLSRISGMLENRPDWCLSRQRYWGTPIPVLHCKRCDVPLLDPAVIQQIEEALAKRGIDAWFQLAPAELAPGAACPQCRGSDLRKETDILDVWFDSGVSFAAVLEARKELSWPADLYVEGSDQHRGWFQVSLIPSVALRHKPPYRQVLTHGFVMDGEGRKMSKSLGNVVAPQDVMERYGADILRLWVASCDYSEDVRISNAILEQVAEAYRKIRNTFRYLLANLYDFDPASHRRPPSEWPELDRWAFGRTQDLLRQVTEAYEAYRFHEVFRSTYHFCVFDLSAFYLDALKDRLYTEGANASKRRCAQTVLYAILTTLTKILAPVLALTTEEVWQLLRESQGVTEPSVHVASWPMVEASAQAEELAQRWQTFLALRDVVMKSLEEQRMQDRIRSPLEAQVTLIVSDAELERLCQAHHEELAEAFVVSRVQVVGDGSSRQPERQTGVQGLSGVSVERAPGQKCQRCWKHLTSVGSQPAHPGLCERCAHVVVAQ
jgi:isoleucyl-tRNA synthetase